MTDANGHDLLDTLLPALRGFDRRSGASVADAIHPFKDHPAFFDALILALGDKHQRVVSAASWVLKDHVDTGGKIPEEIKSALVAALQTTLPPDSLLHLLQALHRVPLSEDQLVPVDLWANQLIDHPRPFVRAWALSLVILMTSANDPRRIDLLHLGERDPAASVRARMRVLRDNIK